MPVPKRIRYAILLFGAVAIISGASKYRQGQEQARIESTANYDLDFDVPKGYHGVPKPPQLLFAFNSDVHDFRLRGAITRIIADYNPSPDLDRDGIASQMAETTTAGLKGWDAKMLDVVEANGITFRLLRRNGPNIHVVNAFGVKGNTTVMITFSAEKDKGREFDQSLPWFKEYLAGLTVHRTERFKNIIVPDSVKGGEGLDP